MRKTRSAMKEISENMRRNRKMRMRSVLTDCMVVESIGWYLQTMKFLVRSQDFTSVLEIHFRSPRVIRCWVSFPLD